MKIAASKLGLKDEKIFVELPRCIGGSAGALKSKMVAGLCPVTFRHL